MYDMYPQSWAQDDSPLAGVVERSRRRPRRPQALAPAVLLPQPQVAVVRRPLA